MVPLSMALNSGLYQYRQNVLVPTFDAPAVQQPQQQQQQQQTEQQRSDSEQARQQQDADAVGARLGDTTLGHIATVVGDAQVYSVIQQMAMGLDTTQAAESIAAVMETEPSVVRDVIGAIQAEYSEVGRVALESIGVSKMGAFLAWARR